jgi:hypothetical protein
MKPGLERRLAALESKIRPNTLVDWQERLARYKRWFVDGEKWEGPQTEKEKNDLVRYKRYFDQLDAGVAAPEWP